jgi:enoyl-CoA hydratase/carnithine racemase
MVASPEHGSNDAIERAHKRRRVVTAAIDRPQVLNALNESMVEEITAVMQAADDPQQGALIFLEKRPPRLLGR